MDKKIIGQGIGIGTAIGVGIGLTQSNPLLGLSIGILIATTFVLGVSKKKKD